LGITRVYAGYALVSAYYLPGSEVLVAHAEVAFELVEDVEAVRQVVLDAAFFRPVDATVLEGNGYVLPAGLDLDALSRRTDGNVVGGNVVLHHRTCADDRVLADRTPRTDHRVVGNARVVLDDRVVVADFSLVDDVVVVAVDVGVVGDGCPIANGQPAAVV